MSSCHQNSSFIISTIKKIEKPEKNALAMSENGAKSSSQRHKEAQIALVKEREKGAKGGSSRPKSGIDTTGRRSTMGQAGDKKRSEDPNNCKSAAHLDWQQSKRLHEKKNFEAEKKKLAKRAAQKLAASLMSAEEEEEDVEGKEENTSSEGEESEQKKDLAGELEKDTSESCFELLALSLTHEELAVAAKEASNNATSREVEGAAEKVKEYNCKGGGDSDGVAAISALTLKEQKVLRKANIKKLLEKSFNVLGESEARKVGETIYKSV